MAILGQESMNNAWSFWQGPMPDWVAECVKTIKKHVPQITILDGATWDNMRPYYDDRADLDLSGLSLNHKSDYIRMCLLNKLGGAWIDCDTIVARPLDYLFDKLAEHDMVCPRDADGILLPGLLFSKQDGYVVSRVRQEQIALLRSGKALAWGDFGPTPMTDIEGDFHDPVYEPFIKMTMPVSWRQARVYERQGTDKDHAETWQVYVGAAKPWTFLMAHGTLKDSPLMMKQDSFFRYVLRRIA